jgi:beta-glucosidase
VAAHVFPDGFLWGVATSAQQIEGGAGEGGRGESIWDRFAATPGRIADGSDSRVACDHFHRWREDVDLMRWLGLGAYRFSIAWPRVVPRGRGAVNPAGLGFYDALVDALLAAGIRPFVTLYHWDLPQELQERGGWKARETCAAFAEYSSVVARHLGDRVKDWATHNEPWCIATLGHEHGEHAPGHHDPAEALQVAHHLLLSHAWAAEAIRQGAPGAEVGIVLIHTPATPFSPGPADRDAARQFDGLFNRWYLDPLFRGRYPEDAVADRVRWGHLAGDELPFVQAGDLRAIAAPLDFLGVNYYSRVVVRAGPEGRPEAVAVVPREELSDMGWEVYPQGLHDTLVRLARDYRPPKIYVTENGMACPDVPDTGGPIADERRIAYLRGHVAAAHRALADGAPLRGYFVWSLLDNFEWGHGYAMKFGLYAVDRTTHQRVAKKSASWFRDVVAANAVDDPAPPMP